MSKNNYWIKGGIINIFQNILTVLFGFLGFYILVRILSKEEYGTWVLFLSTVSIIEIGRNGLTQEASVKYLSSANEEEKKRIITSVFLINSAITIFIIVTLIAIVPFLSRIWDAKDLIPMLHLYSLVFVFSGFLNQLNCIEQAHLNFTGIFYSNITRQLIFFIYVLYSYLTKTKVTLINLTIVQITSTFIATIIAYKVTHNKLKFSRKADIEWIKKIFNFGKYTFGVSISAIIAGSIDQMMLGSMLSKIASGVFNIAVRITNITDIPTNAMVAIVYPKLSKQNNENESESVKYLYEKSVGVILAILIPAILFIYLFSGFILHFIAGNKYDESLPLLKITLLSCIFSPFARQSGTVFNSSGKAKLNFHLVIMTALIIIGFNYFLIGQFGVIGAAYTTLISNIIGFIVSQHFLKKYWEVNPLRPFVYAFNFYPEFYYKYIKRPNNFSS